MMPRDEHPDMFGEDEENRGHTSVVEEEEDEYSSSDEDDDASSVGSESLNRRPCEDRTTSDRPTKRRRAMTENEDEELLITYLETVVSYWGKCNEYLERENRKSELLRQILTLEQQRLCLELFHQQTIGGKFITAGATTQSQLAPTVATITNDMVPRDSYAVIPADEGSHLPPPSRMLRRTDRNDAGGYATDCTAAVAPTRRPSEASSRVLPHDDDA